jgi:hypothetical protein
LELLKEGRACHVEETASSFIGAQLDMKCMHARRGETAGRSLTGGWSTDDARGRETNVQQSLMMIVTTDVLAKKRIKAGGH